MPRRLPPLNAIRAFEASARHGGFVAAAQELGVTAAAVSLQIRKQEDFYEAALFHRLPSGVELTEVVPSTNGSIASSPWSGPGSSIPSASSNASSVV